MIYFVFWCCNVKFQYGTKVLKRTYLITSITQKLFVKYKISNTKLLRTLVFIQVRFLMEYLRSRTYDKLDCHLNIFFWDKNLTKPAQIDRQLLYNFMMCVRFYILVHRKMFRKEKRFVVHIFLIDLYRL